MKCNTCLAIILARVQKHAGKSLDTNRDGILTLILYFNLSQYFPATPNYINDIYDE